MKDIIFPVSNYYPIGLNVRQKKCVVIGGGAVAERKVITLLRSGASITVISPRVTSVLQRLGREGEISILSRPYRRGDLCNAFLIIGATDNEKINRQIHEEAAENKVLANIVDNPSLSNFILPAIVERGDLTISILTGGKSPALSRHLRQEIEALFPAHFGDHLERIGELRQELGQRLGRASQRREAWRRLMARGLLQMLEEHRETDIRAVVEETIAGISVGDE